MSEALLDAHRLFERGRIGSRVLPFNRFRMSQFALIACRVPLETKARVRQLAEREGITESTLLRQLLEVVLRTAGLGESSPIAVSGKVNREARINVRREREDWHLLKQRAKARGCLRSSAPPLSAIEPFRTGALSVHRNRGSRSRSSGANSIVPGGEIASGCVIAHVIRILTAPGSCIQSHAKLLRNADGLRKHEARAADGDRPESPKARGSGHRKAA